MASCSGSGWLNRVSETVEVSGAKVMDRARGRSVVEGVKATIAGKSSGCEEARRGQRSACEGE